MIQAKFGLNLPTGFRGEDFWKSLQMFIEASIFYLNILFLFLLKSVHQKNFSN
jgi:hypothetical protein